MKVEKNKESKKRKRSNSYGIYFLCAVVFLYLLIFQLEPEGLQKSLKASAYLLVKIIPVLLFVIFFMGIINYFVNPKTVSKYVGKGSGIKGWLLAISTGILSHGPIYIWYPLLRDLRNQGMSSGLTAVFLYSRAIKIPLLPLMVFYFGIKFVIVLIIFIIFGSLVEGKVIGMIDE